MYVPAAPAPGFIVRLVVRHVNGVEIHLHGFRPLQEPFPVSARPKFGCHGLAWWPGAKEQEASPAEIDDDECRCCMCMQFRD